MIARRLNWSPDARLTARQLGGAWLCGSALMGTVAWVFLASERIVGPLPARSAVVCPEPLRGLGARRVDRWRVLADRRR